jgi:glycerol-3-phosphate acyltransferase PlsX
VASVIGKFIREEIGRTFLRRVGGLLVKPAFAELRRRTHWSIVGGCLLLGVDGITVIGHGRSDPVAVFHALKKAALYVETNVVGALRKRFRLETASAQ